ncbi:MAG: autotransporter-associated beta strand repeat-containing protein, partial [Deltaproteobacteria bacterium]|nr:autotransporter-associated beta strand repeat-containing protein [Deltaproteobacteria bacterium]
MKPSTTIQAPFLGIKGNSPALSRPREGRRSLFWASLAFISFFVLAALAASPRSYAAQTAVTHVGTGLGSILADSGFDQPGLFVTFTGTGEKVTVADQTQFYFLFFTVDDYALVGVPLTIAPELGTAGLINVATQSAASVANDIGGAGMTLIKQGEGTLALGGANTYDGGTVVNDGILLLEEGASLASGQLTVDGSGTLAGYGSVGGPAEVAGNISPGGLEDGEYGLLTFAEGLTLESKATIVFHLGDGGTAGSDYDSVAVTGGTLSLAGELQAFAASSGTYTLFNYDGAIYAGDGADDFNAIVARVGGSAANWVLDNNVAESLITLTLSLYGQTTVTHVGAGSGSDLDDSGFSQPGLVVTFTGTGEAVEVTAPTQFDALLFSVDGYSLGGDDLTIAPASLSAGIINVADQITASVANNIGGAGQSLSKVGEGTLALGGANTYDGGTAVK